MDGTRPTHQHLRGPSFLSSLDFLEYLESLTDVASIGQVITATPAASLSPAGGYECSATLVGLEESLRPIVDDLATDLLS